MPKRLFIMGAWLVFLMYIILLTKEILFKLPISAYQHHFYLNWALIKRELAFSNFVPLTTIMQYILEGNTKIAARNILGNIIGFMPLGFLLPIIAPKLRRLLVITAIGCSASLMYEIIQLLFQLGTFDVDDLLLNTVGTVFGYCMLIWSIRFSYSIVSMRDTGNIER